MMEVEIWAVAEQVLRIHGDTASLFIAERIGSLTLAGDTRGVSVWREVSHRVWQLRIAAPPASR